MQVKDILSEIEAHPSGTFINLMEFNGQSFGAAEVVGISPVWEMHPDTDEFFYILEGNFEIKLLRGHSIELHVATAGTTFVIPQGIWHRLSAQKPVKFLYYTPGTSLHSTADDPRLHT